MIKELIKYRFLLIFIILLLSSIFIESPFNESYYGFPPISIYFAITLINLLIYLIPKYKFIIFEKVVFSIVVSIFSLIIGMLIIEKILGLIYGYNSNYDELKSPPILNSILFCFGTNLMGIGIFSIWLKYRKPIYS